MELDINLCFISISLRLTFTGLVIEFLYSANRGWSFNVIFMMMKPLKKEIVSRFLYIIMKIGFSRPLNINQIFHDGKIE